MPTTGLASRGAIPPIKKDKAKPIPGMRLSHRNKPSQFRRQGGNGASPDRMDTGVFIA